MTDPADEARATDAGQATDAAGAAAPQPAAPRNGGDSATHRAPEPQIAGGSPNLLTQRAEPAEPPAARRRPPWTLRRRLVVAVVALLALVSIVIGVVSVTILRARLLDDLDKQLASAADRSSVVIDSGLRGIGTNPPAFDILNAPAQASGTLAMVFDGASLSAGYLDEEGAIRPLDTEQIQILGDKVTVTGPVTVDLGGDIGAYRIVAQNSGSGASYLIGLPLADVDGTAANLAWIIAFVSLAGVVVVAALAAWIVRFALRPLSRVTDTAARVAELPLDRGKVSLVERVPEADTDPRTEVGRVGSALNRMLEHVDLALETRQASEHKVRQFVADASHELRTPLASIRGYSELTRRSGQELPPDTVRALDRIESESVRMTGLVEDLLLLARLDEGRELERKPVDLTRLLVDAVSDAHVAGAGHTWNLDLPEEPVEVPGDEARLHQVVANLLANARVHTPEGTTVTAQLATAGDRAIITVTDDGPGIPESLQSTLFERFARGDSSRFRGTGSSGLGLAIARAVVVAHHGEIEVESRPGLTSFRVSLPLA